MTLRNILPVLSICVSFLGCSSESEKTVPDALIGVWKTSAPGYEDNSLSLKKDAILFGVGKGKFTVNSVFKVETVHHPGEKDSLITIYFTDEKGKDNAATIYYDTTHPQELRFKHQMQIEWKLVSRRAAEEGSLSRRRPAVSWWKGFDLNIAVVLLGVALTSGAALWRLHELSVEKSAATIENVEVGSAHPTRGDRESGQTGIAEGGTDWAQAPTAVLPAVVKEQRRSERILLKIPVQVEGLDVHGKSFMERTFTISINRHGAFIWLRSSPRPGDPIAVTNMGTRQSCRFRLCDSNLTPTSGKSDSLKTPSSLQRKKTSPL